MATLITVYTCPPGKTAIVKDIRLSSASVAVTRGLVQLASGAENVHVIDTAFGATDAASKEGFMVLEPGDQLKVYSTGSTMRYWISGAELDGVA